MPEAMMVVNRLYCESEKFICHDFSQRLKVHVYRGTALRTKVQRPLSFVYIK